MIVRSCLVVAFVLRILYHEACLGWRAQIIKGSTIRKVLLSSFFVRDCQPKLLSPWI